MSKSVKKNFTYSSILTLSSYIFPLLTYPYVSRVLGVSNIGICNFVDSIIHYFIMFSTLGISVTGIREIAAVANNKIERSRIFTSLISIHATTTIIATIVLLICIFTIPQFGEHKQLMFVGVMKLLFNLTLIEWFYKGIEDFKYITNRTIIVKMMYVVSVFIFIRKESDYGIYYFLTNMSIIINSVINIIYSRKYVYLDFHNLTIKPLLRSFFVMGLYNLVSSLYTTFNIAYLGMVTDTTQVGYYATAQKIYGIIIALYTAFTGVMMPRMSSLLAEGKIDEFKNYINRSIGVLLSFSIPIIIMASIYSAEIIRILSGPGYEGAIIPMQIVMPLILVIGYEQILVIQTLMPLHKDKIVFLNSFLGAIVGVTLNFVLVAKYGAIGSSMVWLSCELVVLSSAQYFVLKITQIKIPVYCLFKNLLAYIPLVILLILPKYILDNYIGRISFGLCITILYFALIQYTYLKNEIVVSFTKKTLKFIAH